jgi:glycosyltransferase involved in cell wall biosynthesis
MTVDAVWVALFVVSLLAATATAASLVQGALLGARIRRGLRTMFGAYLPRVALVLPVRGLDPGFDENLRAILSQSYPAFRVIAVADESSDPAVERIHGVASEFPRVPVSIVLADAGGPAGKVNALRSGLARLEPADEVVAFADADIRPPAGWLRQLVQPLADSWVGVATGFRWYVPPQPMFWSLVRAEWNAVSANVLFDPRRSFAWGGSSAVRRDQLPHLRLEERWRGVLSDDLVLTDAVRRAGLRIEYVPGALVPTFEGCNRATCLEWCFRQMGMATLYLPIVRRYAAASFAVFNGSVILGILALFLAVLVRPDFVFPAGILLLPVPATIVKAWLRRRALFSAVAEASTWTASLWRASAASLAVPWVMAAGLLRTRRLQTVRWRGRTYDVRDPHDVKHIDGTDIP